MLNKTFITMRTSKLILILLFFTVFSVGAQTERYKWKYTTITHQLLKSEEESGLWSNQSTIEFDKKYETIDLAIDQCRLNIAKLKNYRLNNKTNALEILRVIDSTLSRNRFSVCVKVQTLSEGLELKPKKSLNCCYCNDYKQYREDNFKKFDKVYHLDCDLYSFLYLSIGEALELPLNFVEVPKHNFIRWMLDSKNYINWDVNTANDYSDDTFRLGKTPTASTTFNIKEERDCHYLINLKTSEIIGYYEMVIGRSLKSNKKYVQAKKYYEHSISLRPYHPEAKHCLAYMIVFTGNFNSNENYKLANRLEDEATCVEPKNKEFVETLACSFALLKNFKRAIEKSKSIIDFDIDIQKELEKGNSGVDIYKIKHNVLE